MRIKKTAVIGTVLLITARVFSAEVIQLEGGLATVVGGNVSNENAALGKTVFFSRPPSNPGQAEKALTDGLITLDPAKSGQCANFSVEVDDRLYVCVDLGKCISLDKVTLYAVTNTGTHWRYSAPRMVKPDTSRITSWGPS